MLLCSLKVSTNGLMSCGSSLLDPSPTVPYVSVLHQPTHNVAAPEGGVLKYGTLTVGTDAAILDDISNVIKLNFLKSASVTSALIATWNNVVPTLTSPPVCIINKLRWKTSTYYGLALA